MEMGNSFYLHTGVNKQIEFEPQKQELAKTISNFLINSSNLCFKKCINPRDIVYSTEEDKCVTNCLTNYIELNSYAFLKFSRLNKLDRKAYSNMAKDYGDLYENLEILKNK